MPQKQVGFGIILHHGLIFSDLAPKVTLWGQQSVRAKEFNLTISDFTEEDEDGPGPTSAGEGGHVIRCRLAIQLVRFEEYRQDQIE